MDQLGQSHGQRTYWFLQNRRSVPSDYEITSTGLLYHINRSLTVNLPTTRHAVEHQAKAQLRLDDWDQFQDPAQLTYETYVHQRRDQEILVDDYVQRLATFYQNNHARMEAWRQQLLTILSISRFPLHGLMMSAGFVGQAARGSRLVIACAFQASDELRRIHRFAQLLHLLGKPDENWGAIGKAGWQTQVHWQGARQLIENLLVTYDWSEAFTALNLVVKPEFDRVIFEKLADLARHHSDHVFADTLGALAENAHWHRGWVASLCEHLTKEVSSNRQLLTDLQARWLSITTQAFSTILE